MGLEPNIKIKVKKKSIEWFLSVKSPHGGLVIYVSLGHYEGMVLQFKRGGCDPQTT